MGKRRFITRIVMVAALGAVLATLHSTGVLLPVENLVVRALEPVSRWHFGLSARLQEFDLRERATLSAEIASLQARNERLMADIARLEVEASEQAALDRLRDFLDERGYEALTTRVIGRNPDNALHSLVIDTGRADGVREGMAVIAEDGVMMGKVIDAQEYHSTFLLLDDNTSKIAALVLAGQGDAAGLVTGERGLSLRLNMVPLDQPIAERDLIVTSGLEVEVPRGLLIGEVGQIVTSAHDLFQSASVTQLRDSDSLSVLAVLIPDR